MRYNVLGKTGFKVSELGFGGIPIMSGRDSEFLAQLTDVSFEQAQSALKYAYEKGINFYDTGRDYKDSEERIGKAFIDVRHDVFIASKSKALTYIKMKEDIDQSLKQLNTDYVDLYQLHFVRDLESYNIIMDCKNGAIRALQEARNTGKIRAFGIASHNSEVLYPAIGDEVFDTVQFPFNLIESDYVDIIDKCKKKNQGIIIMKAFAGGTLTKSTRVTQQYDISDNDVKKIALKYILNHKIDTVIPGMASTRQVEENLEIYEAYASGATDIPSTIIDTIVNEFEKGFCRRCQYCEPCPSGVQIEMILRFRKYAEDYGLEYWAKCQYNALKANYLDCKKCGLCETKCPYNLKIIEELAVSHSVLYENDENIWREDKH
jgi:predicted aldo/keto reductase-like oxidoreductase